MYKKLSVICSFITVLSSVVNANSPWDPRRHESLTKNDLKTHNYVKFGLGHGKGERIHAFSDCSVLHCQNIHLKRSYFGDIALGSNAFFANLAEDGSVRNELLFHYSNRHARNSNVQIGEPNENIRAEGGQDVESVKANLKLKTMALFINTYFDLVKLGKITPYVGGGIGLAQHRLSGSVGPLTIEANTSDTKVAWNGELGIAMPVTKTVVVSSAYRYMNLGKISASTRIRNTCNNNASHRHIFEAQTRNHQFLIGLMYRF